MEVFSKLSVGDLPHIFGSFLENRWPTCCLYIPDKPFNMMEDLEGILHTARHLLDAMEPGSMHETVFVVLCETFPILFFVEVASLLGIAL